MPSERAMPETEQLESKTLKKKSVMGRIKSKISNTLGRKKSSHMIDTSPTDKDVKATSAPAGVRDPRGEAQNEATASTGPEDASARDNHDSEDPQQDEWSGSREVSKHEPAACDADIVPFDASFVDDDYEDDDGDDVAGGDPSGARAVSDENEPRASVLGDRLRSQQTDNESDDENDDSEEVLASDYPSLDDAKALDDVPAAVEDTYSDDDDEEEKLEVFEEERGNQSSSRESLLEKEPQLVTPSHPGGMDLVIVGLSPLKLARSFVSPPLSPTKTHTMSPAEDHLAEPAAVSPVSPLKSPTLSHLRDSDEKEVDEPIQPKRRGGIKIDVLAGEASSNDALGRPILRAPPQFSSARTGSLVTKKLERPAPVVIAAAVAATTGTFTEVHSPAKHQPLLSDFQFGSELSSPTARLAVADAPAKRRGAISVRTTSPSAASASATRKSVALDGEQQQLSPKKKAMAMTRLAAASSRTATVGGGGSGGHLEPHEGTQEDTKHSEHPPSSHKTVGSRRRSSFMMDAPILASAAFSVAEEPASHESERHELNNTADSGDVNDEADDEESHSAGDVTDCAFDTGAAITQEFGERVARLLGADPWGDRQDGFDAIQYIVKKADLAAATNRRELFCAALAAVQGGVEDRVAPVMYCALECLRTVLKEFAPVLDRSFIKYPPTNEQISALVKSMTLKLGDSNKRTQREVWQALLRVAKQKRLRTLPHILLHLSAKEVPPRIQVDTLRQFVSSLGVDAKNGLSLSVVMQFAIPALKIADEKTRRAAVELIADLHMLNGQTVNAQLAGVKPEMLRVINRRVDDLLAQREKERETAQNANQAEDAARASALGSSGDPEDDLEKGAELVAVPADESKKTTALVETQLLQAASVIGPVAWRKLESKTWSDRKEALVDMEKAMTEAKSDLRDAKPAFGSVIQLNFLAYCVTVHKCLGDSIAPVVHSAMDCLSTLIKVFGPCVEWREESVRDVVLLTIMRLFSTMQKPNSRTNRAACRSILKFARLANAHTLRYTLSCIFAKETEALVQMHLLRLLIPEFGFQSGGISAALVLTAVGLALVHANEKVRKTAIDVALCTQRLVGKEYVLKKLKDVKSVTLKELEKNFVDCDGKKDSERPQTVHASTALSSGDSGLPPVSLGGGENARRLLNSAPVGVGKLLCTPPMDNDAYASAGGGGRRGSVLSNEEENFMDSILDSGVDL